MKPASERVVIAIPARGGSKGIPRKNLKLLNGRPLISYVIETALEAGGADRVIFTTEDPEIASVAAELGVEVPFVRPAELAEDRTPLTAVMQWLVRRLDEEGDRVDAIVQLQPTCPLLRRESVEDAIRRIRGGADAAVSIKRVEHEHPYRAKELQPDGSFRPFLKDIDVERFQSRQELPELYTTSGAIYGRRRHLLEGWSGKDFAFGAAPQGIVLSDLEATNIDRPIDFLFAEFLLAGGHATAARSAQ